MRKVGDQVVNRKDELTRVRRLEFDSASALVAAGVVAVFVHNFFDFGLEIFGIRLPVAAAIAMLAQKTRKKLSSRYSLRGLGTAITAVAAIAVAFIASHARSGRDFDQALANATTEQSRRDIAIEAANAHPSDYFYPLVEARNSPLRAESKARSPRLAALNRSLQLCPNCPEVHLEVARSLWELGRKHQSLDEYVVAIEGAHHLAATYANELRSFGASFSEIASVQLRDGGSLFTIASHLFSWGGYAEADAVLQRALARGSDPSGTMLLIARAAMARGNLDLAEKSLEALRKQAPQNGNVFRFLAEIAFRRGDIPRALSLAEAGTRASKDIGAAAEYLIELAIAQKRWDLFDFGMERLKGSLRSAGICLLYTSPSPRD